MAKEKKKNEPKIVLEREYNVPLRKEWLNVERARRAKKAVKALKEFISRHMKNYSNDLENVKIDIYLNNEIWYKGMKKPANKIKVIAKKFDDGKIYVELAKIPENIMFIKKKRDKIDKKVTEIVDKKKEEIVQEEKTDQEKKEEEEKAKSEKEEEEKKEEESREKEQASKDESIKISEEKAKEKKHVFKDKKVVMHRKALSR